MTNDKRGIAHREAIRNGERYDTRANARMNCPDGLAVEHRAGRSSCANCGGRVMFVRASYPRGVKRAAHWQHVGDGLRQYRAW